MVDKNRFVRASLVCALLPYRHSRLRSGGGKVGTLSAFEFMRMAAYPLALGASMCVLCLLRFLLGQKPAVAIVIAVVGTTGLICGKLKSFSFAMLGAYGMAKQLTDVKTAAAVLLADAAVMILVFFCSGAVKRRALKGGHYFD